MFFSCSVFSEIFMTVISPEKYSPGYVRFPPVKQNADGREQRTEAENFITIPVNSSFNDSIFVGILYTSGNSVKLVSGR